MGPTPLGGLGDIYIAGAGVSRGYVSRPAATAENFVPDPFDGKAGGRMYRTGDRACRLHDGAIRFLGRVDRQTKIRGFRIELGEVEAALALHPGVQKAVVSVRGDRPGVRQLVSHIETHDGWRADSEELSTHLKTQLPAYMVPSEWVFMDALPILPNGKVDRRALPAPEIRPRESERQLIAPRDAAERSLARIWSEVLDLERIGISDNFFKLGGDSILAIQIVSRAQMAGYRLAVKDVFQRQTIADLASILDDSPAPGGEQGLVSGEVPLSPMQRRFFEQESGDLFRWVQSAVLQLGKGVNAQLLEVAVSVLLSHHDALRLRFRQEPSGWRQINSNPDDLLPFVQIDLSQLPASAQDAALSSAANDLQSSLNLSDGPLVRVALFKLGSYQADQLLLVIHYLVIDGVSWRILLGDLRSVCEQLRRGEAIVLPRKTTSYRQWTRCLEEYASSPDLARQTEYWLNNIDSDGECLPVDQGDAKPLGAAARTAIVRLDRQETEVLLREIPGMHQAQIDEVLLTALALTLTTWTARGKVLVDIVVHGREELFPGVDLSRSVGWFTVVFPLRLNPGSSAEPSAALRRIKDQLKAVPQRGLGYGLLRYESRNSGPGEK
ncbi:MAG: condensation domain-containing protein, partial [Blastocatellia bacterium]